MRPLPLALSGLLLASLTACGLFGSGGLEAGEVVRAQDGAIDTDATGTREVSLQLPEGRLVVTVSAPLPDVPADDTLGEDDLEPADGADLRAVTWNVTTEGTTTAGRALGGLGTAPGSLALDGVVVDDRWQRTGAAYVAVSSSSSDDELVVSMDFDGLTQSVDVASGDRDVPAAAQPLYDEPVDPVATPCAPPGPVAGFTAEVSCRIELGAAPYASGVGWADTPWHVVDLSVDLANVRAADGSTYVVTSASGTANLDGSEPAGTPDGDPSGLGAVVLVFDGSAPATSLEVTRTFELTKQSGPGPAAASYTVSSGTPLG